MTAPLVPVGSPLPVVLPAPDASPVPDASAAALLRLEGGGHVLRVWLGGPGDHTALEADVREVAARGIPRLATLAVALGKVAEHHKLGVRVIPRIDDDGPSVLVIFGKKTARPK
jgi:hypothetical protein